MQRQDLARQNTRRALARDLGKHCSGRQSTHRVLSCPGHPQQGASAASRPCQVRPAVPGPLPPTAWQPAAAPGAPAPAPRRPGGARRRSPPAAQTPAGGALVQDGGQAQLLSHLGASLAGPAGRAPHRHAPTGRHPGATRRLRCRGRTSSRLGGCHWAGPLLSMSSAVTPAAKSDGSRRMWAASRNSVRRQAPRSLRAPSRTSRSASFCDSGEPLDAREFRLTRRVELAEWPALRRGGAGNGLRQPAARAHADNKQACLALLRQRLPHAPLQQLQGGLCPLVPPGLQRSIDLFHRVMPEALVDGWQVLQHACLPR